MRSLLRSLPSRHRRALWQALAGLSSALLASTLALAQGASGNPAWSQLSPAERQALQPLQRDWATIDAPRKEKWREMASRFDRMSPEERSRVQRRMSDWVNLSPSERNEARQTYQGARELSPQERQQRWDAYRALPEDRRRDLATRAGEEARQARRPPRPAPGPADAGSGKVNTVPNPRLDARRPRPVAPNVVQARPGATTTPLSARPAPPLHQQAGLPKVAATPGFVDSKTLLPQRGAQGAGTEPRRQPAAPSAPRSQDKQKKR